LGRGREREIFREGKGGGRKKKKKTSQTSTV
jgi:hypothetical protein